MGHSRGKFRSQDGSCLSSSAGGLQVPRVAWQVQSSGPAQGSQLSPAGPGSGGLAGTGRTFASLPQALHLFHGSSKPEMPPPSGDAGPLIPGPCGRVFSLCSPEPGAPRLGAGDRKDDDFLSFLSKRLAGARRPGVHGEGGAGLEALTSVWLSA